MGTGGWILLLGSAAMLGLLVRELWRVFGARAGVRAAERERVDAERRQDEELSVREQASRLEPGGTPESPIEVAAASVVEARASAEPCLRCGHNVRVEDHAAETHGAQRLRVARVECTRCGYQRARYFRIAGSEPALH